MRVFYIIVVFIFGYSAINGQNFVSFSNKTTILKSGVKTNNLIPGGFLDLNGDLVDDIMVVDKGFRLHTFEGNVLEKPLFQHISEDFPHYFDAFAMLVCDVNGDEKQDVFLGGSFGYIQLYLSSTTGVENIKIPVPFLIQTMNAADINTDGIPDLFVCNDDGKNEIFINNGSGSFTSNANFINFATIPTSDMSGNYGSVWVDVNGDKYPDLAIAKCRAGVSSPADPRRINTLFIRQANGTYVDKAKEYNFDLGEQSWAVTFGDYDNDGDMDAFVANHYDPHVFLENVDGQSFQKRAFADKSISSFAFQVISRDFDNDGLLDIILSGLEGISFLHNKGNLFFEYKDVFERPLFGMSTQAGDVNDDGFIDFHSSVNQPLNFPGNFPDQLYINNGNDHHFFKCNLQANSANTLAVGATLFLYGPWGVQTRQIVAGESYGITTSYQQHFGLGQHQKIDSLVVFWPSGEKEVFTDLESNATFFIQQGKCANKVVSLASEILIISSDDGAELEALPGFEAYEWNTGETNSRITVKDEGMYFVKMTDEQGCITYSKPVYVEDGCFPQNAELLNYDQKISWCAGTPLTLESLKAKTYNWNSGSTTASIDVTESGWYIITATDYCNVTKMDSVEITMIEVLKPNITYEDTILKGQDVTFRSDLENTYWYGFNQQSVLEQDSVFTLKNVQTSTFVFARAEEKFAQNEVNTGLRDFPSLSSYGSNQVNSGLEFSVFQPITLQSVKVYTDKPGKRKILIRNEIGDILFEKEFDCAFGENVLSLNAELSVGMNYSIITDNNVNLEFLGHHGPRFLRHTGQEIGYPFEIDQVLSIDQSLHGTNFYYFFYDWKISYSKGGCASEFINLPVYVDLSNNTVDEENGPEKVLFSPNPCFDFLVLKNGIIDGDCKAEVYSVTGVKMGSYDLSENNRTIPVTEWQNGTYIIKVRYQNTVYNQKIVKTTSKP